MSIPRTSIFMLFLLLQICSSFTRADSDSELEALLNELDDEKFKDATSQYVYDQAPMDEKDSHLGDATSQYDQAPMDEKDSLPGDATSQYVYDQAPMDAKDSYPEADEASPLDKMVDEVDHMKEQEQLSELNGDLIGSDDEEFANTIPDKTDVEFVSEKENQLETDSSDEDMLLDQYDEVKYEPVGCYKDGGSRPLPVLLANLREKINWKNLNQTISTCAQIAHSKGYSYFGVQFYGECWSGPGAEETYNKKGPSENCIVGVGEHWTNFVYRIVKVVDEVCENYKTLDEESRSLKYGMDSKCDKDLSPGWYRFTGSAGSRMANKCVLEQHCGTHSPGWMTGALPSVVDGRVERKVCFTWGSKCCKWDTKTTVRNCGGFYVYKLIATPMCTLRYCGNGLPPGSPKRTIGLYNAAVYQREVGTQELTTDDEYFLSENEVRSNLNDYEPLGCYLDKGGKHRPLPVLLKSFRGSIDWKNLNKTIQACAVLAQSKGLSYFGLEFWGECWSGQTADQTYDKDGPSKNCASGVGAAGSIYVYRFKKAMTTSAPPTAVTLPNECLSYKVLDSADRARTQGPVAINYYKCDSELTPGWYRFDGSAGTQMADSCVPKQHCGTHSPGWLKGPLPSVADGRVERKVCFNWIKNCCYWSTKTTVRNCGGFYVYQLDKPPMCKLRYCGNGLAPATTAPQTTAIVTTKPPKTVPTTTTPTPVECTTYKELDSSDRAKTQGPLTNNNYKCDDKITTGWYRFTGSAGSHMATSCVGIFHCGTHSPGWMNGSLPSVADGRVAREGCFHWNGDCCHWRFQVAVRNCSGFYVFQLKKPANCRLRYCGNGRPGTPSPTTNIPTTAERTTRMPTTAERTTKTPTTVPTRPWPRMRRFILCQSRKGLLRCPFTKRIKIRYANYGRTTKRVCRHPSIFTTRCFSGRSRVIIRRACNGRNRCRLSAKNYIYGNPCWGTYKYIDVKYQCI